MAKFPVTSIVFFVLMMFTGHSFSQTYPLQHFTTENGLPSNTIYEVYRDSKGFLWMGTDNGVVKYNGIEFEKFTTDDGLADNEIFYFREDYEGRLWMETFNGELCYYKDGTFHTSVNTPFLKKYTKYSFISWLNVEKDSSVTISFHIRLAFLNIKHDVIHEYPLNTAKFPGKDLIAEQINKMSEYKYNIVCEYNSFNIDTLSNYVANSLQFNKDHYQTAGSQDKRYLYSANGIYSDQSLQFRFGNELSNSYIYTIYNDDSNWFIGTTNGLFINNNKHILTRNKISGITQDIEGNFWMSTLTNGLFCMGKDYANYDLFESAYSGVIRYAGAVGNALYFTTDNGNFYRLQNNKINLLLDYFNFFSAVYNTRGEREKYSSQANFGRGIYDGTQYYSIQSQFSFMIDRLNTKKPAIKIFKHDIDPGNYVKEIFFGKEKIVIRHSDFISYINIKNMISSGELVINRIGNNIRGKRIFGVGIGPDQSVWYSSFERVNKIVDSSTIPQYQFGDITFKWMVITGNYAVGITHKNQLLVCRDFGNSNIRIDSVSGEGADLLARQNFIWIKLYKLNDTTFLVSTDNLYRLLSIHPNALPDYDIRPIENISLPMQAEYICANDSFCYFFKKGSVTRVRSNDLVINHLSPVVYFKFLKTRNKSYPIKTGMEVEYNESKDISISFSPFSFGSKYLICKYSISKDSTNFWRQVKNNEINLFDPGFGTYTVKIMARTLSGDFGKPFVFQFTILKPFWAEWWFISFVILAFTSSFILIIRVVNLRNVRKRELTHLNEIKFLKSEYKALNALMNPHFIFNTLNNVQWLVNNNDKITANHYIRIFSDLIRQNMHNISKELISLSKEVELVSNYLILEKLRFKEALNYEIKIDDELDIEHVKIPPLLIQPLVENAIKHGLLPGTTTNNLLKMNIYRNQNKLYIDIEDNGVGFNESQKRGRTLHQSTGIENIRKRIEKLSLMHDINISLTISELEDKPGFPAGTLARVCIDINEE